MLPDLLVNVVDEEAVTSAVNVIVPEVVTVPPPPSPEPALTVTEVTVPVFVVNPESLLNLDKPISLNKALYALLLWLYIMEEVFPIVASVAANTKLSLPA